MQSGSVGSSWKKSDLRDVLHSIGCRGEARLMNKFIHQDTTGEPVAQRDEMCP